MLENLKIGACTKKIITSQRGMSGFGKGEKGFYGFLTKILKREFF